MPVPEYEIGWLLLAERSYEVTLLTSIRHYYLCATGPYPNDSPNFAGLQVRASEYAWCLILQATPFSAYFRFAQGKGSGDGYIYQACALRQDLGRPIR